MLDFLFCLQQAKSDECPEGVYARIHGVIRPMDNQYPLVAFSIKPVTDFNEVGISLREQGAVSTGIQIC